MKKIIIAFIVLSGINATAQVKSYNLLKECSKFYDKDLNGWTEWKTWRDIIPYEYGFNDSRSFVISPTAIRMQRYLSYYSREEQKSKVYEYWTETLTIGSDLTAGDNKFNKSFTGVWKYDPRRDKGSFENPEYSASKTCTGNVYSPNMTWEEILSGNGTGDIYFSFTWENGDRNIIGLNINKKSRSELEEEKEVAAKQKEAEDEEREERIERIRERAEERKRQQAETYRSIGTSIGTIIQQRKKN